MPEYSCFLHPLEKSKNKKALCPQCRLPFDFPLDMPPAIINGRRVLRGVSRGFYSAVFLTEHPALPRQYAVKVIPVATYASVENGGYGKDFQAEAKLHAELSAIESVATLLDVGQSNLTFGTHTIGCYWMEMEYVDGETLEGKVQGGPESPREVAQIAWDLLDLVESLQQRGHYHNDLHGENILVVSLPEARERRRAINPRIQVKALDLGSAGAESKSNPERLSDVHWVARHIVELVNSYERNHDAIDPATLRLSARLRQVGEVYCGRDRERAPKAADLKADIEGAYRHGIRPWGEPVRLASVSQHYNAQTLPSWFAPELLYDPGERWAARLTGPGPQLLVGMRGCGKTILLRSLEWVARSHRRPDDTAHEAAKRVAKDSFLGLFVSCASLLRSPRAPTLERPLERLFLAFAREVIRDLQLCELDRVGEINYGALERFNEFVAVGAPWFERSAGQRPTAGSDLVALEHAISRAFLNPPANGSDSSEMKAHDAFSELVFASRQLLDLWAHKTFLFLLDDVSQRYLPAEHVDNLLSRLCLQSPDFGFKISTENQTLSLTTPGGEVARSGRDYDTFDLGVEVLATLRGKQGPQFIEEVLKRRSRVADAVPSGSPAAVLGRQRLRDIATAIRQQPSKSPVYWGIDALAGTCVGDIGDVLQIYARILERAGDSTGAISAEVQHKAMLDFAEPRLFSLAGRDEWLYAHAVAFAAASYRELKTSTASRLREYAELFVKIAPDDAQHVFRKILNLIDAGVFVFSGGTPRTKTPSGQPYLQFKLAFRKVLGLTNRMPLAMRDRFELSGKNLVDWLDHPSAARLRPAKQESAAETEETETDEAETATFDPASSNQAALKPRTPAQLELFAGASEDPADRVIVNAPRVLRTVETLTTGVISNTSLDWSNSHLIGAFGFEIRSMGAWTNLLRCGRPGAVTMLQYPDVGLAASIIELLRRENVQFTPRKVDSVIATEEARAIIGLCDQRDVVIDTTSLTKALIYSLVLEALRGRSQVWILHTCAEQYIPSDEEVEPVVSMLQSKKFPDAFREINRMVAGESGPYQCCSVGEQFRDPSQPSHLVAFVPLKYDRLAKLLDQVPVESITAVAPFHSSGEPRSRCKTAEYLAHYFVQRYGGAVEKLSSLDSQGTFELLSSVHRRYALEAGLNFEIALTGAKMQCVGAAMFASTAAPGAVYYSAPTGFDPEKFTKGTGPTRVAHIRVVRREAEQK